MSKQDFVERTKILAMYLHSVVEPNRPKWVSMLKKVGVIEKK